MQGRLENELKQNEKINKKMENVPDYVRDWYMNLKASNKTSATCKDYINKILKFLYSINSNICDVKLSDINLANTQKFFISIQTKEVNGEIVYTSDSYQQTIWCCLNNFFEYLLMKFLVLSLNVTSGNDLPELNLTVLAFSMLFAYTASVLMSIREYNLLLPIWDTVSSLFGTILSCNESYA